MREETNEADGVGKWSVGDRIVVFFSDEEEVANEIDHHDRGS